MYKIELHKRVKKHIKKIHGDYAEKVKKVILLLSKNPFNPDLDLQKIGSKPLIFRCRIGDYRILYAVYKNDKKIYITRIEHRQWGYKTLFSFLSL